jgi:hypothetical protein
MLPQWSNLNRLSRAQKESFKSSAHAGRRYKGVLPRESRRNRMRGALLKVEITSCVIGEKTFCLHAVSFAPAPSNARRSAGAYSQLKYASVVVSLTTIALSIISGLEYVAESATW